MLKLKMSVWLHDRDRWFLWSPILFGLGIHCYFSGLIMNSAQIYWIIGLGIAIFAIGRKSLWAYAGLGIICIGLGIFASSYKTTDIASHYTKLDSEWGGRIRATVKNIDVMDGQIRLLLDDVKGKDRSFNRIRVNFRHKKDRLNETMMSKLRPGVQIRAYVRLTPIPPRETPLNYDFQFWSFFQGVEATGFGGTSSIWVYEPKEEFGVFEQLRYTITKKMRDEGLGQPGEIAIALTTGYVSGISKSIRDDFAGSGIAHILAISGLHLSLIGGMMFLIFRRGLGFSTKIALHWPLKKIAAALAILCSYFYLKISGEGIPTIRSFIMFSLIMGGIIWDRDPISLRSVAWAALVVLVLRPESMYSPSFQMSFAAVIWLIGTYEYFRERSWNMYAKKDTPWYKKFAVYIAGSALSSLIASMATLPFIMHTFHRFSWHSIEANLIAIPLMSFWIMPLAILVVIGMPFGLHGIPLLVMSWGCQVLMQLANTINSWPGTYVPVGVRSGWFMTLILAGSFWWLIWTHRWRWLGIPAVIFAFFLPKKDIFLMASNDQSRIGIMAGESVLLTPTGRPNFVSQDWKGIAGLPDLIKLSKAHSQWITPTNWGWMIQPFVKNKQFNVAVITDINHPAEKDAIVSVIGFPKVKSVIMHDGTIIKGGCALWKDSDGSVKILQETEDKSKFPWR
ncbi:ComE operon protein 3 [Candidatus Bodocaedibacter vickermanii]|uniref:ComE operon protein 3 n=2 Tax=Candidatus Bodocaedibacter vickermanii TaxID=2741701 RepID=A0A7L9RUG3_9PROT|nr:ComE operon protein 3 [Candidatus Paracaedibacteraceae bacterium 'Lake Konstanz']